MSKTKKKLIFYWGLVKSPADHDLQRTHRREHWGAAFVSIFLVDRIVVSVVLVTGTGRRG